MSSGGRTEGVVESMDLLSRVAFCPGCPLQDPQSLVVKTRMTFHERRQVACVAPSAINKERVLCGHSCPLLVKYMQPEL